MDKFFIINVLMEYVDVILSTVFNARLCKIGIKDIIFRQQKTKMTR